MVPAADEQELKELYHEKQMSLSEIGDQFGVVDSTVLGWMDDYGIERRDLSEAQKNRYSLDPVPCRTRLSDGYELWHHRQDILPVHRLVAVAEFGFDAVCGLNIHHQNGIPWDNRPSNLQVINRQDHARLHEPREFDESEAEQIRSEYDSDTTQAELAEKYGVSQYLISNVVNRNGAYSD